MARLILLDVSSQPLFFPLQALLLHADQLQVQRLHGEKNLSQRDSQRGKKEKKTGSKDNLTQLNPTGKEDQDTEDAEEKAAHSAGLHIANKNNPAAKTGNLGQKDFIRLVMVAVMQISDP